MSKCLGKDRNNNACRSNAQDGTQFCKNHQYMVDYTPEMLLALQLCKGCMKMYFFEGDAKQCAICKERGKESRAKAKENVVLCKSDGCKFKRSVENIYCGLHQICLFVDECTAEGVRPCVKYLKGCRTKLGADYANKSCQECLQKERERDKARRSVVSGEVVDGMKQCSVCCQRRPIEAYSGAGGAEMKTCKPCRDENKRQDEKRDKEHKREIDRIGAQKPERQAVKREWREANPEKVALGWLNYRDRQHNENQEEYLKRNAEIMSKWRENNPKKVEEMNDKRLHSIEFNFIHYKYDSTLKRREFNLSFEQFETIVKSPCFYCGIIQDKGFNGIDKTDQTQGYVIENCVSCCKLCNFMKGAVDNITFLQRVEHILKRNTMITGGNYYPDAFQNHQSVSYASYKQRAERMGLEFELTVEDFDKLILENCYICGKKTDENHTNGVDRFDNERGYTFHNSNACCGECNVMKNTTDYDVLLEQFKKIYDNTLGKEMPKPSVTVTSILSPNLEKMTRPEVKEYQQEQREAKRKAIREKYADEEFKKQRAAEIAKNRRNV
jgi:hypothetical protein